MQKMSHLTLEPPFHPFRDRLALLFINYFSGVRKNINNKQIEYEGLGNHYLLGFYSTSSALEWGLMGLHAFHSYCPSFRVPVLGP
jgi:hypothetical protein